jgi:hypothetical protein
MTTVTAKPTITWEKLPDDFPLGRNRRGARLAPIKPVKSLPLFLRTTMNYKAEIIDL